MSVAAAARRVLAGIAGGRLARLPVTVRFWDGSTLEAQTPGAPVVIAAQPEAVRQLLHSPDQLGLARAWVDGSLSVDGDLEDVLVHRTEFDDVTLSPVDRLRIAATAARIAGPRVLAPPPIPAIEASLNGGRHSLLRDRAAVRHHYDVSNDFYRLLLGPSMVYSCAYFADGDDTLEAAQERKLDLICRKLALAPGDQLLDIGCGWGSLLLHAATHYGVHGVGVTLSEPQAQLAQARAREQRLEDRVEVRVADYRELTGRWFDKIASVGMYEHVGLSELDGYARTVREMLRPGGLFLNHGIARLASVQRTSDTFISRYVFPDGELHPVSDLMLALQHAELEIRDVESLREHYPITLRRWLDNLSAHHDQAVAMVGDQRDRAWQLYMLGSAQAFEAGEITVYQVLVTRPDGTHGLPLDRAELLARIPDMLESGA
jgi:cyclopropane-fatty-acyl-phospholipid synthase